MKYEGCGLFWQLSLLPLSSKERLTAGVKTLHIFLKIVNLHSIWTIQESIFSYIENEGQKFQIVQIVVSEFTIEEKCVLAFCFDTRCLGSAAGVW